MIRTRLQILGMLLMRVAEAGDKEAVFLFDEVRAWPSDAVPSLMDAKLLREVRPSQSVVCRGCEKRCLRPVDVVQLNGERPPVYVSTCNEFPDMGPFEHPPSELKRWSTSRELIARFVSRAIALSIRSHDENWRRVVFQTWNFQGVKRALSIEFEKEARIKVGGSIHPLIEVLAWDQTGISVDHDGLSIVAALSDDQHSGVKRVQSSTALRDANKVLTRTRNSRLQQSMEQMAKAHPNLNKDQLAHRIARIGEWRKLSPGTIARVTRMSEKKSGRK